MSDPLTDILAAISLGRNLSNRAQGHGRAQGAKLAWEKALLDAERWAQDVAGRGARASAPPASAPPAGPAEPAASGLGAGPQPAGRGAAGSVTTAPVTAGVAPRPDIAAGRPPAAPGAPLAAAPAAAQSARPSGAPTALARAAAPPPPAPPGVPAEPRSVRLLLARDGFEVVIRDPGLDEAGVRRLVDRVQAAVGQMGVRVGRIVVNGLTAWEDTAAARAARWTGEPDDPADRVWEIEL